MPKTLPLALLLCALASTGCPSTESPPATPALAVPPAAKARAIALLTAAKSKSWGAVYDASAPEKYKELLKELYSAGTTRIARAPDNTSPDKIEAINKVMASQGVNLEGLSHSKGPEPFPFDHAKGRACFVALAKHLDADSKLLPIRDLVLSQEQPHLKIGTVYAEATTRSGRMKYVIFQKSGEDYYVESFSLSWFVE